MKAACRANRHLRKKKSALNLSAAGGRAVLPESTLFISFISRKAALSSVLAFNKAPPVFFWEPGRRPADRFTGLQWRDMNEPYCSAAGLPELSESLNRPQQRYRLHCFCTFSFRAQWKMKMKRPEEETNRRRVPGSLV